MTYFDKADVAEGEQCQREKDADRCVAPVPHPPAKIKRKIQWHPLNSENKSRIALPLQRPGQGYFSGKERLGGL